MTSPHRAIAAILTGWRVRWPIVNVLDPDIIVLGGGMGNVQRLYADVPALMKTYVFSDEFWTPIVPPLHGDASGVRGAAWLWGVGE